MEEEIKVENKKEEKAKIFLAQLCLLVKRKFLKLFKEFGRTYLISFISVVIIHFLNKGNLELTIYPICILFSFLIIIIISGKIEINFANILKIKKDTEEIKREIDAMKTIINIKNDLKSNVELTINSTTPGPSGFIKTGIEESKENK